MAKHKNIIQERESRPAYLVWYVLYNLLLNNKTPIVIIIYIPQQPYTNTSTNGNNIFQSSIAEEYILYCCTNCVPVFTTALLYKAMSEPLNKY